jgi:hypothetical protein
VPVEGEHAMKKLICYLICFLFAVPFVYAQGSGQGIDSRIQPPLELHDISQRLLALEQELAVASREAEFWRNARFYNDKKRERKRVEQLVHWSQKTVAIRNEMTRLKQDRSYYLHKQAGNQRFYYKKD